ncbi:MAG: hypothetical protein ACMV0H_06545, partial [Aquaspirillum sp.]
MRKTSATRTPVFAVQYSGHRCKNTNAGQVITRQSKHCSKQKTHNIMFKKTFLCLSQCCKKHTHQVIFRKGVQKTQHQGITPSDKGQKKNGTAKKQ